MMDDILIHGCTKEERNDRLRKALQHIREAGATLNSEKCEFTRTAVNFLGHVVDASGIRPDPDMVTVITELRPPTTVGDVRRILGMFTPNLADITRPLRELLVKGCQWVWESMQQQAFRQVKKALVSTPILALFDVSLETMLSADASSNGLGAILLQRQRSGNLKPVAHLSESSSLPD